MSQVVHTSFERCCRLCAEDQDVTIMIFGAEAEAMLLQNKLNKYLLIEVDEDDKLPKNICIQCCSKLQAVCEFIDTAHKAQAMLNNRSLMLDTLPPISPSTQIKSEPDDDTNFTEMEINVDPMMVLQNSDEPILLNNEDCEFGEDITHLHEVDRENVTIKLIKRGERPDDVMCNGTDNVVKPFQCVTCRRGFQTELALKNHLWAHSNEDKLLFKCNSCHERFQNKNDLIIHLKQHKVNGLCQLCGRIFRTESNLAIHMRGHLSESQSYPCKVCGRSYNTQSNLKTHSITHSNERPYHCHLCKKSFKRKQDLKFHINQHTGAKPYKCPFCEKCFASSGNCYSHRSRMHPGKRMESKLIRRNTTREQTPRVVITKTPMTYVKGVYKYQCELCDHSFLKREGFIYHMFTHTGEKPFNCQFCEEKFVTRRGLLIHHDKKHPLKTRSLGLISKNVLLK